MLGELCYVPFILLFHSVLLSVSIVPSRSIIPFRSIVLFYCPIPCSVHLRIHSDTSIISLSSLRELRTSSVIRLRYYSITSVPITSSLPLLLPTVPSTPVSI